MKKTFCLFCLLSLLSLQIIAAQEAGKVYEDPRKHRIDIKSLPPVTGWMDDTESKVVSRSQAALKEGPEALEKLATTFETVEIKDKDGRYTTPYFFKTITEAGDPIGKEERNVYQERIFKDWRAKFPASKAAVLAQAKLFVIQAEKLVKGYGRSSLGGKWEVAESDYRKSKALLEECRDLQSKDPAWAVTYFPVILALGESDEVFQKEADRAFTDFPDSEYVISRVVNFLVQTAYHKAERWEPWLREKLARQTPENAAKCYARVFMQFAEMYSFNDSGVNPITNKIDRKLMEKGFDLLAKEYPDSVALASGEAMLAAYLLDDRARTKSSLLRANAKFDELAWGGKQTYDIVLDYLGSIAWDPNSVGLPVAKSLVYRTPAGFNEKMKAVAKLGPGALEKMIQEIRSKEVVDEDGIYPSIRFFDWFSKSVIDLPGHREDLAIEQTVKDWKKEYPASPFAHLAAAQYGIHFAWEARGAGLASTVTQAQWKEFAARLKIAREELMAAKELKESEPAWYDAAFMLYLGESNDDEFEEAARDFFKDFPECNDVVSTAFMHLQPRWGGRPGLWEPWLKDMIQDSPDDVKARAYASAALDIIVYAEQSADQEKEVIGSAKIDKELLKKGMELLKQKYPNSLRIASGDAFLNCHGYGGPEEAYQAMKKIDGRVYLPIWNTQYRFDHSLRWVIWKKTK